MSKMSNPNQTPKKENNATNGSEQEHESNYRIEEIDGKTAIFHVDGDIVIPPVFDELVIFIYGVYKGTLFGACKENGSFQFYKLEGKSYDLYNDEKFDAIISYPNKSHVFVKKNNQLGLYDPYEKKWVIEPEIQEHIGDSIGVFLNDFFAYKKNDKWGLMDAYGSHVPPKFDDIDVDFDDYAKIKLNGQWGYCNEDGEFVEDSDDAHFFTGI